MKRAVKSGFCLGLIVMLSSGCHAGWLNPTQPGFVLQTYTTYQPISGNNSGTIETNGNSYQFAGDNSGFVFIGGPGAQFRGKNEGTVYLDGEGGYVMGAFGPLASVTNRGKGSLMLGNLSGGQRAIITDVGHGSLLLGAGVVSNSQSIVVGDDNASHGAKSVTAGSFWATGLGFFGKGAGLTDLPTDLTRFGAAEGLVMSGRVAGVEARVSTAEAQVTVLTGQVADVTSKDVDIVGDGMNWVARDVVRNWTGAAICADGRWQTVVVQNGAIYVSGDYGNTWTARGSSKTWDLVAMSASGAKQTAAVNAGQLYFSNDYGNTWTNRGESRCWNGLAMSASGERQTVVEDAGLIYVSSDTGMTWAAKGFVENWTSVSMSSNGQYQTASFDQHEDEENNSFYGGGLAVSSDYGNTWTVKDPEKAWKQVVVSGNGARQAAVVEGGGLYVSSDYGATWAAKETNRNWLGIAMSADGKRLSAIVAGQAVYVSHDYGESWSQGGPGKWWGRIVCSSNGGYQLASIQNGQIWVSRADSKVHGDLAVDCGLILGNVGQLMIRGGTQLVFVAGTVTNVLDNDVGTP
jgi:hypothetical protein